MRILKCLLATALGGIFIQLLLVGCAAFDGKPACYPTDPKLVATYTLDMRSLCKGLKSVTQCVSERPDAALRKAEFQADLARSIECTSL